jgi:hypothetical protein
VTLEKTPEAAHGMCSVGTSKNRPKGKKYSKGSFVLGVQFGFSELVGKFIKARRKLTL